MTPTAQQTSSISDLTSPRPAENVSYVIASNLAHNLTAMGLLVTSIHVVDVDGAVIPEATFVERNIPSDTPLNWMILFEGLKTPRNCAEVARRVRAVQTVEDQRQAYAAWQNLYSDLVGSSHSPTAIARILDSPVVEQACVRHLRSINLQGLTFEGGTSQPRE